MSFISLEGSIRTCKVDSGWANKVQSDRFLNSNLMLCPPWNGYDTAGRPVCADSFVTKTAGCNSANDRVVVENALRPQYIEYVNLDAQGIRGGLDCGVNPNANMDMACANAGLNATHQYAGQFGVESGFQGQIRPNCLTCPSATDLKAMGSQQMRNRQWQNQGYATYASKQRSGM